VRKSLAIKPVLAIVTTGAVCIGLSGFAYADAAEANAADAIAAIRSVAPATLSDVARVSGDDSTAAEANVPGGTVSVPVDPAEGIDLGGSVGIGLPFAQQASVAVDSPVPGVVAFDNNNGSTTVPVISADGMVQINTVIEHASAPTRYDYPLDVPDGASLAQDHNGTVAIVDADGSPLRVFGAAWAKDAHGLPVPTHYEVRGNTLTQVVDFTANTAFPVVADPSTGVYSYNCVLTNGQSVFLKPGEKLTNCKGSYLQKYINGTKVLTVSLVYNGKPTANLSPARGWCVVSLTSVALLAWNPPTATAVWLIGTAATAVGAYGSCYNL
jgi:hypothetical protein